MKKLLPIFALTITFLVVSCGPTPKEAVEYSDKIIEEQSNIQDKLDALDISFKTYIPSDMKNRLEEAKKQLKESTETVENMEDFYGNEDFKKATLDYFDVYDDLLESYYTEMVEIMSLPDSLYTTKEKEKYQRLNKAINNTLLPAFDEFIEEQKKFADEFEFDIEKTDYSTDSDSE